FEQDRPDHLAVAEAGRCDDPGAHLMDEVEHLLVARPRAVFDPVTLECLGRGPARLVERGDEAVAPFHLRGHFRLVHASPLLFPMPRRPEAYALPSIREMLRPQSRRR